MVKKSNKNSYLINITKDAENEDIVLDYSNATFVMTVFYHFQ